MDYGYTEDEQGPNVEQQQFMQSVSPDVLAQIEALKQTDPEAADQLMNQLYQDYTGQEAIAGEQTAQASALRDTAGPEGRQAGRTYVAANPLEHLGAGLRQNRGRKEYGQAMDRREGLSRDRTAGVRGTAEMMMPGAGAGRSSVMGANAAAAGAPKDFNTPMSEQEAMAILLRQGAPARGI